MAEWSAVRESEQYIAFLTAEPERAHVLSRIRSIERSYV